MVAPKSEQLHAGTAAHEAAGQRVATAVQADRVVKGLVWAMVGLVMFGVLVLMGR